jgi:hypothetical protein
MASFGSLLYLCFPTTSDSRSLPAWTMRSHATRQIFPSVGLRKGPVSIRSCSQVTVLTKFILKMFRTDVEPALGLHFQTKDQSILENCTEQKSAVCKFSSGKLSKQARTISCKPDYLKIPECRKTIFTGLYLHGEEAQIQ